MKYLSIFLLALLGTQVTIHASSSESAEEGDPGDYVKHVRNTKLQKRFQRWSASIRSSDGEPAKKLTFSDVKTICKLTPADDAEASYKENKALSLLYIIDSAAIDSPLLTEEERELLDQKRLHNFLITKLDPNEPMVQEQLTKAQHAIEELEETVRLSRKFDF
jgi:hypothetical protein